MLKSAKDMSQVSHQALLDSALKKQAQQEAQAASDEIQRRAEEERKQRHANLITQALATARKGECSIVVTETNLDFERLTQQGFIVERLMRREAFEQHLRITCQQLESNGKSLANQLMQKCPESPQIKLDHYSHRNPLISLLRTLQATTAIEFWANIDNFKSQLYFSTNQGEQWLNINTKHLQEFINLERKLYQTQIKLNSVSKGNAFTPNGFDAATLVSWEGGGQNDPQWNEFSATHLFWLSTEWEPLQDAISKIIDKAAATGLFVIDVSVSYDSDVWRPLHPEELEEVNGRLAHPLYIINELEQLGYSCELQMYDWIEIEDDYILNPDCSVEQFINPDESNAYCVIEIGWMNELHGNSGNIVTTE